MSKIKLLSNADNNYRTQKQAIEFHNQRKERMLSMPDIFQLVREDNTEAIESLRKDFDDAWLVTSTQIIYNPKDLSATIIHNAGSNIVRQKEIKLKEVPDYTSKKLANLLDTDAGLNYIRALIDNPRVTKEQIIDFFVKLSGKKESNIRFWTPSQSSRASKQVRSVVLYFGGFGGFVVNGDWFGVNDGLSREVVVESAKQTKFFSNRALFNIEEKLISIPMTRKIRKDIERRMFKNKKVSIKWNLKVKVT